MDIPMDISMDIHIHGNPGDHAIQDQSKLFEQHALVNGGIVKHSRIRVAMTVT